MKTIKFCLLLALLSSPIFIFSSFRPEKEIPLKTTIHADAALNRLRVVVNKPSKETLTLRVFEADGWLIHEEPIAGGTRTVQANLNLCALPNNTYRVEVIGQDQIQSTVVQLLPSENPTLQRRIDLWPVY